MCVCRNPHDRDRGHNPHAHSEITKSAETIAPPNRAGANLQVSAGAGARGAAGAEGGPLQLHGRGCLACVERHLGSGWHVSRSVTAGQLNWNWSMNGGRIRTTMFATPRFRVLHRTRPRSAREARPCICEKKARRSRPQVPTRRSLYEATQCTVRMAKPRQMSAAAPCDPVLPLPQRKIPYQG